MKSELEVIGVGECQSVSSPNNDTNQHNYRATSSTRRRHSNSHEAIKIINVVTFVALLIGCFRFTFCRDLLAQQDRVSGSVLMLSRGQEYDVTVGSKLVLDCEFHMDDYEMFHSPTVWEKTQMEERTRLNIMAAVQEPFASTRRFDVSFETKNKPRHLLRLAIKDLSLEDSGNYTCEIRGWKSTVLSHVTHVVHVRWPLQALYMTSDIDHESSTYVTSPSSLVTSSMPLNEGQVLPIRCVVQSGCPSPVLTMRVGAHDVTSHFRHTEHPVVITGERGLRAMVCMTSLWSSATGYTRPRVARPGGKDGAHEGQFIVLERYDGSALRCSASPGPNRVEANGTEVKLLVQFAPQMTCTPASAELYARDVKLECRVRSRPRSTSLYWIVDSNGTMVSSGESISEHVTQVRDADDITLVTSLILRRAGVDSFRKYQVVAENAIGKTIHDVDLLLGGTSALRVPPTIPTVLRRPFSSYITGHVINDKQAWLQQQQQQQHQATVTVHLHQHVNMENNINGLHERLASSSSVLSGTACRSLSSADLFVVLIVANIVICAMCCHLVMMTTLDP